MSKPHTIRCMLTADGLRLMRKGEETYLPVFEYVEATPLTLVASEILEQLEILVEVVAEAATGIEETHSMTALYLREQIKIAKAVMAKVEGK